MLSTILLIILLLYIIADWENSSIYVVPLLILVVAVGIPALIISIYRHHKKDEEENRELYKKMVQEEKTENSRLAEIKHRVAAFSKKYGKPDIIIPSTCSEPRFLALFNKHKVLVINNIEIAFADIVSYKLIDNPDYVEGYDDYNDVEYEKDYSTGPYWCAENKVVEDVWREPKQHKDSDYYIIGHHYTLYATLNYTDNPKISIEIGDNKEQATQLKNIFSRIVRNNKSLSNHSD